MPPTNSEYSVTVSFVDFLPFLVLSVKQLLKGNSAVPHWHQFVSVENQSQPFYLRFQKSVNDMWPLEHFSTLDLRIWFEIIRCPLFDHFLTSHNLSTC